MGPKFAPFRSISYGFRNNGQFTFPKSCDLEGSCDLKIEIFKSCNFVGSKPAGVENSLRFALSLTVFEKTAILIFFKNWPKIGRQMAVRNLRMSIFDWLLRNHLSMMPVKFQSIISKNMACIDVTRIC